MSNEKDKDNLPKSPEAPPAPPPRTVAAREAPRVARKIMRGQREFEHHLFKLKIASCKKNVSWKWKQPQIKEVEHVHWFHSLDDRTFQPENRSQAVAGHYHEVTFDFNKPDALGNPHVVCGPPLRLDTKKLPGGRTIQVPGPVVYEGISDVGEEFVIRDAHTHEIAYEGSEMLTANGIAERRANERAAISTTMEGVATNSQPAKSQALQNSGASVAHVVQE